MLIVYYTRYKQTKRKNILNINILNLFIFNLELAIVIYSKYHLVKIRKYEHQHVNNAQQYYLSFFLALSS